MDHDLILTDSTLRAYERGWQRFTEWCASAGRDPCDLDGAGATVAEFVKAMGEAGLKPSTVNQWLYAIRHHFIIEFGDDIEDPAKDPTKSAEVRRARKSLKRRAARRGQTVHQANELTKNEMERVLRCSVLRRSGESAEDASLRHLEAEAVVRLMFDSCLRADEAFRAEWRHLSDEAADNGHRTLYIPVSKTDQEGRGRYGNVSPVTWEALERWRAASGGEGRISTAPSAGALGKRIARMGRTAGVRLSGHSLRSGVATTLGRNGASEYELMAVGGWKSPENVRRYVRAPKASANAVTSLYNGDHDDVDVDQVDSELPAGTIDPITYFYVLATENEWRATSKRLKWTLQQELLIAGAALSMAVELGADKQHDAVARVRDRIMQLWPMPEPPADCDREGCCGLQLTASTVPQGGNYCSPACRDAEKQRREKQRRADS